MLLWAAAALKKFPPVQKGSLAAVEALRKVVEHQGNAAAHQVTLPALTPVSDGYSSA